MSDSDRRLIDEFAWASGFPVYGLADGFTGRRWVDGVGSDKYGPNALVLGHAPGPDDGTRLLVGCDGYARGDAAAYGHYEMRESLASGLVNGANEQRYLACETHEERRQLARHLMAHDVPNVRWVDTDIEVDGELLTFAFAEAGTGNWCAVREFTNAFVWMSATDWSRQTPVRLVRIQDLTSYL